MSARPVPPIEPWTELDRLVELCGLALDGEGLDRDAVECAAGEPRDVVLGTADGTGAMVVAPGLDPSSWHLQLAVVEPSAQGLGVGRALLAAALRRASDEGAERLVLGGAAEDVRYLWPGVGTEHLRMLALADSSGIRWDGAAFNMACATTYRARPPAGVELRRVIDEPDAAALLAFVQGAFPHWVPEVRRGIEHASALLAERDGAVLGFACHSVNRGGWFGPTGVDPAARGSGLGAALLAAACRDLMAAGYQTVEISWIGPVAFYAKTAHARISRVFRTGWWDLT